MSSLSLAAWILCLGKSIDKRMAISEEEFKTEMMRFVEIANHKFDGLTADVRSNSFKLDRIESKVENLEVKVENLDGRLENLETKVGDLSSDLRLLSAQFNEVGSVAIKDHPRINELERRVDVLESETH